MLYTIISTYIYISLYHFEIFNFRDALKYREGFAQTLQDDRNLNYIVINSRYALKQRFYIWTIIYRSRAEINSFTISKLSYIPRVSNIFPGLSIRMTDSISKT